MRAGMRGPGKEETVRSELTRDRLRALLQELARSDPYAQILSKIVRGFRRDLEDARHFLLSRMVEPARLRSLVRAIPEASYSKYPSLSPRAVIGAVEDFLATVGD